MFLVPTNFSGFFALHKVGFLLRCRGNISMVISTRKVVFIPIAIHIALVIISLFLSDFIFSIPSEFSCLVRLHKVDFLVSFRGTISMVIFTRKVVVIPVAIHIALFFTNDSLLFDDHLSSVILSRSV
ncbi:hypothetical protein RND71_029890 [Anisodus tanguticus]|uniref:Uncharacterized protein n=1 Tax=Anisodus tanguticus TaxID=243964 RepID=A0AAE1RGP3_9SOLA|nr:hypothetical protein RND71_029890 [Anisodus tanguticus]